MVKLKECSAVAGKKQVVRFDAVNNLLVMNGKRYGVDYDSRGLTHYTEVDMCERRLVLDRIIRNLRGIFDVDMVLRLCLSVAPLRKLRLIDRKLKSKVNPVMKMIHGGDLVVIGIGKLDVPITCGEPSEFSGLPAVRGKFRHHPVVGEKRDIIEDVYYNLLIINGIGYAFDYDDAGTSLLVGVDIGKHHELIDSLIRNLRAAFDIDMVLRCCLSGLPLVNLGLIDRKLKSKVKPVMKLLCVGNLVFIRIGNQRLTITDGILYT